MPALLTSRREDAILPCILKPYNNANLPKEQLFDEFLSKHCELGELAFKKLKGRWKILREPMKVSVGFIPKVIVTCCILHNILESRGMEYLKDFEEVFLYDTPPFSENVGLPKGEIIRDCMKNYIFTQFA